MVEPEQALQPVRILLVALEPVDERELLVDQAAAAPRQRLEHVADLQLQPALLACQEDGLLVEFVDGVGDLPDLLGGVHRDGLDGARLLAGAHVVDLARQIVVSDPQSAVAQRAQRPHQRPGHEGDEQQRQQDRAEHDRRVANGLGASGRRLFVDGAGDDGHRVVDHLGRDLIRGRQRREHLGIAEDRHVRV